jgi:glycosyltransferase involved in cell wall biosynthesis
VLKICIVTPDIIGPIKNGGIGTHCYYLGRFLAAHQCQVTVLYTGPFEHKTASSWQRWYANMNIEFVLLDTVAPSLHYQVHGSNPYTLKSQRVYEYLARQEFCVVFFQDWQANGFVSIQMKRMGLAFSNTLLTVTAHSCSEWIREGMNLPMRAMRDDAGVDYCERYCCQYADLLLSPSRYMLDWLESHFFILSKNTQVIPYLIEKEHSKNANNLKVHEKFNGHLAFFGRLERRKGLHIFCQAVTSLLKTEAGQHIQKISFVGKVGECQGQSATEYIRKSIKSWPKKVRVVLKTNLDQMSALTYLRETRASVCIPSLLDNLPYTVLECLNWKIPFIASHTGGIPEVVSAPNLFEPTPLKLSQKMESWLVQKYTQPSLYTLTKVQKKWLAVAREKVVPRKAITTKPLVSICIPYYNYGKYLPILLTSLAKQTYPALELIVVNDGSTDVSSRIFDELEKKYESYPTWHFFRKENEGLAKTRNFAAAQAKGKYLIFMDADNIAREDMVEVFVAAILYSGTDCLTCYFTAFEDVDTRHKKEPKIIYGYSPIGPCMELGCVENVFGDANFIINREVFQKLHGFGEERDTSYEDWEFLARLNLQGYAQDVIPQTLFYYRHTEAGYSRNTDMTANHLRTLHPYLDFYIQNGSLTEGKILQLFFAYFHYGNNSTYGSPEVMKNIMGSLTFRIGRKIQIRINQYPYMKRILKPIFWRFGN